MLIRSTSRINSKLREGSILLISCEQNFLPHEYLHTACDVPDVGEDILSVYREIGYILLSQWEKQSPFPRKTNCFSELVLPSASSMPGIDTKSNLFIIVGASTNTKWRISENTRNVDNSKIMQFDKEERDGEH